MKEEILPVEEARRLLRSKWSSLSDEQILNLIDQLTILANTYVESKLNSSKRKGKVIPKL